MPEGEGGGGPGWSFHPCGNGVHNTEALVPCAHLDLWNERGQASELVTSQILLTHHGD